MKHGALSETFARMGSNSLKINVTSFGNPIQLSPILTHAFVIRELGHNKKTLIRLTITTTQQQTMDDSRHLM